MDINLLGLATAGFYQLSDFPVNLMGTQEVTFDLLVPWRSVFSKSSGCSSMNDLELGKTDLSAAECALRVADKAESAIIFQVLLHDRLLELRLNELTST